jgi:hypothetical protein
MDGNALQLVALLWRWSAHAAARGATAMASTALQPWPMLRCSFFIFLFFT